MTIQGVKNMTLSQIPDFHGAVGGATDKITAVRVKGDIVDTLVVGIIVLNKALRTDIPDFNGFIGRATSDTGAIGVESDAVDTALVVIKATNLALRAHIPQLDEAVFST